MMSLDSSYVGNARDFYAPLLKNLKHRDHIHRKLSFPDPLTPTHHSPIMSFRVEVPIFAKRYNTHRYLSETAIKILLKDMKNSLLKDIDTSEKRYAVKQFFKRNIHKINQGAMDPDILETDPYFSIPSFEGHFYDPDTGKNFRGNFTPTAYTRFVEHSINAKSLYKKGDDNFAVELGRALHYLCDAGEPHHSSNKIAYMSNHLTFEKYARLVKDNIKLESSHHYYSFLPSNLKNDFEYTNYCQRLISHTAHFSKKYRDIDEINFTYSENDSLKEKYKKEIIVENIDKSQFNKLNITVVDNIKNCQSISAAFLYNFLRAVDFV